MQAADCLYCNFSALFCLIHILCSVTIKAPHIFDMRQFSMLPPCHSIAATANGEPATASAVITFTLQLHVLQTTKCWAGPETRLGHSYE